MVNPPEYNEILEKLRKLPDEWDHNSREMKFEIIAHPNDAGWVSTRIYKEVDEGRITANIRADKSEFCIIMHIILSITTNVNVNVDVAQTIEALTALIVAIKHRSILAWSERKSKKLRKKLR